MEKAKEKKGLAMLFAIVAGFATVSVELARLISHLILKIQYGEQGYYIDSASMWVYVLETLILGVLVCVAIISEEKKKLFFTLFASFNIYKMLTSLFYACDGFSRNMREFDIKLFFSLMKTYGGDIMEALLGIVILGVFIYGIKLFSKRNNAIVAAISMVIYALHQIWFTFGAIIDSIKNTFAEGNAVDVSSLIRWLLSVVLQMSVALFAIAIAAYFIYLLIKSKKKPVEEQPAEEQVEEQVVME